MVSKSTNFYKQRFVKEKNSLLRNLKIRVLDENKNNKLKRITKILNQLDFNCWFNGGEPVYQICKKDIYEYVCNKDIISDKKYQTIWDSFSFHKVYKTIMELESYRVYRTVLNYPFLELNEFYWKEKVFYSKKIPVYLILHEEKEGPIHCERCKFKMTKYNYLQEYCSKCRHTLENKYYNHKGSYIQSNFKKYDFTKKVEYTTTSACPNISVLPNSFIDFPNYYVATRKTSYSKDYDSGKNLYNNGDENNPYGIITYKHENENENDNDNDNDFRDKLKESVSDTILQFIESINIFKSSSSKSN